jgi:uncharacterized protein YeeX (DUF496 family)
VRLIELTAEEKARALYEAREKERRDNRAREKGAVMNVALNALRKGMSIEDIIDITKLTREEVETLRQ